VISGEVVLVECFFPDGGLSLRFGTIECAGSLGWSVTTADGIHILIINDADDFFDDTCQPHQVYKLSSTRSVERW